MTAQTRNFMYIALAAGAVFALGLGVRQAQALFIAPINSSTGIGYASISPASSIFFSRSARMLVGMPSSEAASLP